MQELFLDYRWPELWRTTCKGPLVVNSSVGLWKAALLAAWWQSPENARKQLPVCKKITDSHDPLLLFVSGLIALCSRNGSLQKTIISRLIRIKGPVWMSQWLALEETGRRRNFEGQALLLEKILTTCSQASWPYVACLQSLDQPQIEARYLLNLLSTHKQIPPMGNILRAFLLKASGQTGEAVSILEAMVSGKNEDISPVAAYHLGFAAESHGDLTLALRAWDHAAKAGFMDRPAIAKWIALSLSHPGGWESTPARIKFALLILANPSMKDGERVVAALLSNMLIFDWIEGRFEEAFNIVSEHHTFPNMPKFSDGHPFQDRNEQVFFAYIIRLCAYWQENRKLYLSNQDALDMYCIGESHSLSIANLVFPWEGSRAVGKAGFVMGLKMWHLADPNKNYHKFVLNLRLAAIPKKANLLFCVGEIDCRPNEGIWKFCQKKNITLQNVISNTVNGYIQWLGNALKKKEPAGVTIQGVPAPAYPLNGENDPGDKIGFVDMIRQVNEELKTSALAMGWKFLDVYSATVNGEGVSNRRYHIDGYHLSPGFYSDAERWLICQERFQ